MSTPPTRTGPCCEAAKSAMRRELRARRDAWPEAERRASSARIQARVLEHAAVRAARVIFCYVSVGSEVDTRVLIDELSGRGHQLVIPCCADRIHMGTSKFLGWSDLLPGRLSIPSSPRGADFEGLVDLALVPGLAFTDSGDRLGYGAGYYDRWFARHPRTYRLGLAHEIQLVPELVHEPHDVRMHEVLTGAVIATGRR